MSFSRFTILRSERGPILSICGDNFSISLVKFPRPISLFPLICGPYGIMSDHEVKRSQAWPNFNNCFVENVERSVPKQIPRARAVEDASSIQLVTNCSDVVIRKIKVDTSKGQNGARKRKAREEGRHASAREKIVER